MRETGAAVGIATDGDADRFGIVDEDGTFVQPNYIIALLFDYLVETRGWKNGVGKSVATTNLINALAEKYKVELHETPVGFKYIGELIKQDRILIGGEESAGLSIRKHVPEERWSASRSALLRDGGASRGVSRQTARRLTC
jgi:phosphomannomutase